MVESALIAVGVSVAVSAASAAIAAQLTPTQKIDRGGLSDFSIPKSNYGAAIPQCWGEVKTTGNLIWSSSKREKVKTKKKGGGLFSPSIKIKERSYFISFAVEFAYCPHRPAESLQQLWLNGKLVYDVNATDPVAIEVYQGFDQRHMTFFPGSDDQPVYPFMQILKPIQSYDYGLPHDPIERAAALTELGLPPNLNHIPAYRKKCILTLEDLPLEEFNNQIPTVKANILYNGGNTLETIVTDICNQSNITNFDTSALNGIPVSGFINKDLTSAKAALTKLQQAYFFDIFKSGDVMKFVPYDQSRPTIPIPDRDLAAHTAGSSKPKAFEIPKPDPENFPESVEITFIDKTSNQEPGTVLARSQVSGSKRVESYTLPIVMTADEAQKVVDNLLFQFYLKSMKIKSLQLSRKYAYLEVGDRLQIDFYGEPYILQITKIAWGANLLLKIDTEVVEAANLKNIAAAPPTVVSPNYQPPTPIFNYGGATNLEVMDINKIDDTDSDYGLYLSANGGSNWKECSLYFSNDDVSYSFIDDLEPPGTMGSLSSSLDENSTSFTVSLTSGELESISSNDYDSGINKMLVGNEILQFQNVTDNGSDKELSILRRGIRGTETFINSHAIGERVILLTGDSASIERVSIKKSDIGQTRYFKAPSPGQTLDQAATVPVTIEGLALKPYAPVNLAATVDNPGNITLTWDRRDRNAGDATSYENLPLSEQEERWEIEVVDNSDVVIRLQESLAQAVVYTTAQQVDDFGVNQSTITVNIYQMSAVVGRGYKATATLTPTFLQPDPVITEIYPNPALIGSLITIEGTGLNQVDAVFFSDLFPAASDLAIIDDTKIRFRFNSDGFADRTQKISFITNNDDLPPNPPPELINIFTDTKLSLMGVGSDGFMKTVDYVNPESKLIKSSVISYSIPDENSISIKEFPYTISPSDIGKELVFRDGTSAANGSLLIPNDSTEFVPGWGCVVTYQGDGGDITITREDGTVPVTLVFSGGSDNNHIKEQGTIAISHRGSNIWLIVGALSSQS